VLLENGHVGLPQFLPLAGEDSEKVNSKVFWEGSMLSAD
jgi:hypothetical protein